MKIRITYAPEEEEQARLAQSIIRAAFPLIRKHESAAGETKCTFLTVRTQGEQNANRRNNGD